MKAQLLKKLTNEELHLLGNVTHSDIIKELESRKPKINNISVNIGDCFYSIDIDSNIIYLIKVTDIEDGTCLTCNEISIDDDEIDYYDISYHIDDTSDWKSFDINLYENILALLNSREDAISKIEEQFNGQIRKLCQEVNQNQEK